MDLSFLIGADHYNYKVYKDKLSIVIDNIDELLYISKTLDYNNIVVFLKEIIETFDFFKNIDENDDYSEGYSNMDNKEDLVFNIIESEEYKKLILFMDNYRNNMIRKCENLQDKIVDLGFQLDVSNKLIIDDFKNDIKMIKSKMEKIGENVDNNTDNNLPDIAKNKIKFNIKLITKNDFICILNSYKFVKNFLYKNLHVINKEYYTVTKDDIIMFKDELYTTYVRLCLYFNKNKGTYIYDINEGITKIEELLDKQENKVIKEEPQQVSEPVILIPPADPTTNPTAPKDPLTDRADTADPSTNPTRISETI
jgi:hypothetical protein